MSELPPPGVPLVPEIEAPPDHLQTPLATYLGDVAGAIRVASNFDGKRKKGKRRPCRRRRPTKRR